ncbi:MAG: type I methionyl aminopeptidase [Candidatus Phytoplasma australasiaticum]|uniref:Methionine aminopeptidase n=2 Tax=16SrII (Peanut WB group) TaxID=85621 RepID=A0A9K3WSD7_9MOLU|nr:MULTISPECIES: type I methionyl aminopeptidase [Phytoplasma]MCG3566816.1 type I methionyl aminopeptidase [Sesame phyllody phytoplasma]MDO8031224.1 type I methionyl aminopeptidase [Candidatus Phytoplasma australasiaticum]MDO8031615.1 type I methionyl aminopeptidase [Candidatus Phytoplasma australasiaticum]MDO8046664.1 type I methionyl aminopeptidase [Candidatus Phytoplasma australasiaticum]MDO8053197.1 type I methionyl aminopeptidase [Candidatus Phytoplasma australasiaticum]
MLFVKKKDEIAIMKMAGKILSQIKKKLIFFLKEGISTGELDLLANKFIKEYDVISAFKNYDGFPGYICTSVNDAIVHGVPSDKEILKTGDIITIDLGIKYQGYFVDAAWTYAIGDIPDKTIKLLKDTQEALYKGIEQVYPGNRISNISNAIFKIGILNGYGIIESFSGHGIGKSLHEKPYIFNFNFVEKDYVLVPGMTFCIEPMFTLGSKEVKILPDGWTAVSKDNSLSAHFEHTILVTDQGYEILTL